MSAPHLDSEGEPGGSMSAARLLLPLIGLLVGLAPLRAGQPPDPACAASAELQFVCGAERPEDLARIPGSPWLIASGFSPGAGLKLIDTRSHTLRRWYAGSPDEITHDVSAY